MINELKGNVLYIPVLETKPGITDIGDNKKMGMINNWPKIVTVPHFDKYITCPMIDYKGTTGGRSS